MNINATGMTPIKKEQFCEILERTKRFSKMVGEVDKVVLDGEMTVEEFIALTKNAFGGDIIIKLEEGA